MASAQRPCSMSAHPLCQHMQHIRKRLRLRQAAFSASSTDANLPLSQGIPSPSVSGMTRGGLAHTVREYIDIPPDSTGTQAALSRHLATLETAETR